MWTYGQAPCRCEQFVCNTDNICRIKREVAAYKCAQKTSAVEALMAKVDAFGLERTPLQPDIVRCIMATAGM